MGIESDVHRGYDLGFEKPMAISTYLRVDFARPGAFQHPSLPEASPSFGPFHESKGDDSRPWLLGAEIEEQTVPVARW